MVQLLDIRVGTHWGDAVPAALNDEEDEPHAFAVNRRQFLTATGAGLAGHPRRRRAARSGPAARDLVPLLEQLRPGLRQEAGRDRPALHQGHGHQAQDRPHLPHGPAAGQVRLRGPDPGRPRPRRDAHALPVALRAAARGRLGRGGRAREEVRQGALLLVRGGARQRSLARRAAVPRHVRGDLPRGPLQEGEPQGARHLGRALHRSARSSRRWGIPSGSPSARTTIRSRRRAPCCGRSAAWRWTRTARRSASTRPATVQTIEWYKKMFRDCMEPEVLSWSDASNNESIQQGKAGWIHNPVSAYIVAKQRKLVTADGINHHRSLGGPQGRHETDTPRHIGIWKFSKNVEPAKEWIRYLLGKREVYDEYIMSGDAFNLPDVREAPGPPGAPDRPQVRRAQGRGRAVPHLRLAGAAVRQGAAHHQHVPPAQHDRQGGDRHLDQGLDRLGRERDEEDPRRCSAWLPSEPTRSWYRAGRPARRRAACGGGSTASRSWGRSS